MALREEKEMPERPGECRCFEILCDCTECDCDTGCECAEHECPGCDCDECACSVCY